MFIQKFIYFLWNETISTVIKFFVLSCIRQHFFSWCDFLTRLRALLPSPQFFLVDAKVILVTYEIDLCKWKIFNWKLKYGTFFCCNLTFINTKQCRLPFSRRTNSTSDEAVSAFMFPACRSSTIFSAVANASFMVVTITPTGPCFTQPLQYKPVWENARIKHVFEKWKVRKHFGQSI